MTDYRAQNRTPARVTDLEKLVQRCGDATGVAPGRVRRWITMMVMIGALDRVQADPNQPLFLVKGGVAMELRLGQGARATRDLDMVFLGEPDQLLEALDTALAEPYSHFSFERGAVELIANTPSRRLEVKLAFNGRSWATLKVEISPPEGRSVQESQILQAISIEDFGLTGPELVRCLSIRYQIAQKLHACTRVFTSGRENDRFRDLIDLLLLRALDSDLVAIRHASVDIFGTRGKHEWPPTLTTPDSWTEPYTRLAEELDFEITDVKEAAGLVTEFIVEIDEAVDIGTPVPPRVGQSWRRSDGIRVEIKEANSTTLVVDEADPILGTTVSNAISPSEVQRMVLIDDPRQPLWRITVSGAFGGPAYHALLRVGSILGAVSHHVDGAALGGPRLQATIVAPDSATAKALARSVLPASATILEISRERAALA